MCSGCGRSVSDEYFEIGGRVACRACSTALTGAAGGTKRFVRALMFGGGAAVVSMIVWYAIIKFANMELGLIAIGVGLFIGMAVRRGAGGLGGWKYQALAMVLTYGAVTVCKVPLVYQAVVDSHETKKADGDAPADEAKTGAANADNAGTSKKPGLGTFLYRNGGADRARAGDALLRHRRQHHGAHHHRDRALRSLEAEQGDSGRGSVSARAGGSGLRPAASGAAAGHSVSALAPPSGVRACKSCGSELPLSLLACPGCGALVHAEALRGLAADAERIEQQHDVPGALAAWRRVLELLPVGSGQYQRVFKRVQELSAQLPAGLTATPPARKEASPSPVVSTPGQAATTAPPRTGWRKWLGGLGAIGVLLAKMKWVLLFVLAKGKALLIGLTQVKTLLSMAVAVVVYTTIYGWRFAIGLVLSIYVHEMGHVVWLRRYGIPASAPMFIPGLGAFVRLKQRPATAGEDARVGLAGPVWGAGAAVAALLLGRALHVPILSAIARVGAWINLFNLIPVWQLDGGRGFVALSRRQRAFAAAVLWTLALSRHEGMLYILAIAVSFRAASATGAPERGDRAIFWTYVALVVGLTWLISLAGPLPAAT